MRFIGNFYITVASHPVGIDGQNHIIIPTPIEFLPIKEFEKSQKSIDHTTTLALMKSFREKKRNIIEKKQAALKLKNQGNTAIEQKNFENAEKFYSEALHLNLGSRPLWTNRAACRNIMKKYEEAISDCENALSIDPKCTRTIIQKGNALVGLDRFDEAKNCYESLRSLGEATAADDHLKKLNDIQERISSVSSLKSIANRTNEKVIEMNMISVKVSKRGSTVHFKIKVKKEKVKAKEKING